MTAIRKKAIEGIKVGDTFTVTRTFSEKDMLRFAEVTRDYNPVHFDDRFSNVKKFNGRICHGLLVASIITEVGGQIGWLASGMNFFFKKPVYFNDTITCNLTIKEIDPRRRAKAEAVYVNQDDEVVLKAYLTGIVPGPAEQQVLNAMMDEGDPTNRLSEPD
jgi:acyl dehydratase